MPVDFRCPHCGQMVSAPDDAAGTLGTCAFCGGEVRAPGPNTPEAAPYAGTAAAAGPVDVGDVISQAWSLVSANWQTFAAAALIVVAAYGVVIGPPIALSAGESMRHAGAPASADHRALAFVMSLVAQLLVPLQCGLSVMASDVLATGATSVGRVFSGYRRFGRIVGMSLILSLAMQAPSIAFNRTLNAALAAPASLSPSALLTGLVSLALILFLSVGFWLAPLEILDRGAMPAAALRASWEAVRGRRWAVLATMLLLALISGLGVCACYIGVAFTLPVGLAGQAIVYRNLRGLAREGEDLYAG